LTENGRDRGRRSFLGSRVPRGFEVRRIVVDCGAERIYDQAEWLDAIVLVEEGEVELECVRGSRHRFGRGDLLWLAGLPLRVLRCRGSGPVVLLAVSRPTDELHPVRSRKHGDGSKRSEREVPMTDENEGGR
jgi:hypothetical protein